MSDPTRRTRDLRLRIGSRGSRLALAQSGAMAEALAAACPGLVYEIVEITTTGDRTLDSPLPAIGGKGLFTREIGDALLRGDVDLAIHSLKDLPASASMPGLAIAAIPARAPANDALISAGGAPLDGLPEGARIGTSSPRRAAQLLAFRPDLRTESIRGNVDTRIRKLREGHYDAIVLALAGLVRLGLDGEVTQVLPFDVMLPAPGQGALGLEMRAGNAEVASLLALVADPAATACTAAERTLLQALGGGCSLPLGAHATLDGDTLTLRAALLSLDGTAAARGERTGPAADPDALAHALADDLRQAGADAILQRIREESPAPH